MKKIIAVVLCAVLMLSCFSMVASAKVGDVIGLALHTDIVAYINHYAIPSYAVNGQSVIVAEDLRNFGFDVTWDQWDRSLTISRNWDTNVKSMSVNKAGVPGTKFTDIYATDIKVYAGGRRITSYAMNGYTMVPMEELTMFGEVHWVQNERALKMWVDGLHMRTTKQPVNSSSGSTSTTTNKTTTSSSGMYYPNSSVLSYTYITGLNPIYTYAEDGIQGYVYKYDGGMSKYESTLTNSGWDMYDIEKVDGEWHTAYTKGDALVLIIWDVDGRTVTVTFVED